MNRTEKALMIVELWAQSTDVLVNDRAGEGSFRVQRTQ